MDVEEYERHNAKMKYSDLDYTLKNMLKSLVDWINNGRVLSPQEDYVNIVQTL